MNQPLRDFIERRFGSADAPEGSLKRVVFVEDETPKHVLRAVLAGIGLTLADFTDFAFFKAMGANPGSKKGGNQVGPEVESFQLAIQENDRVLVSCVDNWTKGDPYYTIKAELSELAKSNPDYGDDIHSGA